MFLLGAAEVVQRADEIRNEELDEERRYAAITSGRLPADGGAYLTFWERGSKGQSGLTTAVQARASPFALPSEGEELVALHHLLDHLG